MKQTREQDIYALLKNASTKEQFLLLLKKKISKNELKTWENVPYTWAAYMYNDVELSDIQAGLDICCGIIDARTIQEMQTLYVLCEQKVSTLTKETCASLVKMLNYHKGYATPHWVHISNILNHEESLFEPKTFQIKTEDHPLAWIYQEYDRWPAEVRFFCDNVQTKPKDYLDYISHNFGGDPFDFFHKEFQEEILKPFRYLLEHHEQYPDVWQDAFTEALFDLTLTLNDEQLILFYSLLPFAYLDDLQIQFLKLTDEELHCLELDSSLTVHHIRKNRPHYEESIELLIS